MSSPRPTLLAISSGGGHWIELLRLRPAFEGWDVTYAPVRDGDRADLEDGNRWSRWNLLRSALADEYIVLPSTPSVNHGSVRFAPALNAVALIDWTITLGYPDRWSDALCR